MPAARLIVSSFNHEALRTLKTWEPLLATSLDPTPQDGSLTAWELCQQVLGYNINAMQHGIQTLTPESIDEAHQHGFSLWTWTVNTRTTCAAWSKWAWTRIMTDHADVLRGDGAMKWQPPRRS